MTTTTGGGSGANVAAIEAQIAQVSTQIAAANITAPIAGVVTAIYNEDRQMAIADRPVYVDSTRNTDGSCFEYPS